MPLYSYTGSDLKGKTVSGMVDAVSKSQAHQKLKARHVFPTRIDEDMGGASRKAGGEDIAYTAQQLAALLRSGIPMDEALDSLSESAENPRLRTALARARVRLREGEKLSSALTEDNIFPPMLVRMVGAGEEAGKPAEIIGRYAEFLQSELDHQHALQSALSYPIVLVSLSIVLLGALITFLTPVLQQMYESAGAQLPPVTQLMVTIGDCFRTYGWWGVPVALILTVLAFRAIPTATLDRWKLTFPLLGPMMRAGIMSRWARTFAMLQGAGVPLLRSLQLSREVVGNMALDKGLRSVEVAVERGDSLTKSLGRVYLVPALLQQFIRTGERTGDLEPMLTSAAEFYERELNRKRQALVRWLEPAIICFMGLVVGMLVFSALMPLSQLATKM